MPYIPQGERPQFEYPIDCLSALIETDGQLNYVISRLVIDFAKRQGGNYTAHARAAMALEMAKMEYYRRHVAPYEDKKIKENGDVPS